MVLLVDGDRAGGLAEQPPAPHGDVLGAQALSIVNAITLTPGMFLVVLVCYRVGHLRLLLVFNVELAPSLPREMRV